MFVFNKSSRSVGPDNVSNKRIDSGEHIPFVSIFLYFYFLELRNHFISTQQRQNNNNNMSFYKERLKLNIHSRLLNDTVLSLC